MLDTISPIYPINAFDVVAITADTTVLRTAPCVLLSAAPLVNSYDTVYWLALHPNGTTDTLGHGQWQIAPCPDSTTTYLIAMHDSTTTCAGTWWSYDTVVVTVVDSFTSIQEPRETDEGWLLLYPNPTKDKLWVRSSPFTAGQVLEVWDVTGRMVLQQAVTAVNSELSTVNFPSGIYLLRLGQQRARFVKE